MLLLVGAVIVPERVDQKTIVPSSVLSSVLLSLSVLYFGELEQNGFIQLNPRL